MHLRKCSDTIASTLGRLIDEGFVTRHRRSKQIRTPQGERWVQDSGRTNPRLAAPVGLDPKISGGPV